MQNCREWKGKIKWNFNIVKRWLAAPTIMSEHNQLCTTGQCSSSSSSPSSSSSSSAPSTNAFARYQKDSSHEMTYFTSYVFRICPFLCFMMVCLMDFIFVARPGSDLSFWLTNFTNYVETVLLFRVYFYLNCKYMQKLCGFLLFCRHLTQLLSFSSNLNSFHCFCFNNKVRIPCAYCKQNNRLSKKSCGIFIEFSIVLKIGYNNAI